MPDEQPEKPRVKTWKTLKRELDTANERLAAHDAKRAELVKVQADGGAGLPPRLPQMNPDGNTPEHWPQA